MWARLANIALGIWLMFAPAVLDYGAPAATSDRVVGPLTAMFACIAVWEVTRMLRWLNLPLGIWLVAAPLFLDYPAAATWNSVVVGGCCAALALVRGPIRHRIGGGWRALLGGA